jgi:hypothetical protein
LKIDSLTLLYGYVLMGNKRRILITIHIIIFLLSLYLVIDFLTHRLSYHITAGWVIVYQCFLNLTLSLYLCRWKRGIIYHLLFWTIEVALLFSLFYQRFFDHVNMSEKFETVLFPYQIVFIILLSNYIKTVYDYKNDRPEGIILEEPISVVINGKKKIISQIQPGWNWKKTDTAFFINSKKYSRDNLDIKYDNKTIYNSQNVYIDDLPRHYLTHLPWEVNEEKESKDEVEMNV